MNDVIVKRYEQLAETAAAQVTSDVAAAAVIIQVGSATCENAAGAPDVWREFERNIKASGRTDIALHRVGCTGRCSREPIVGVLVPGQIPVKYQRVNRDTAHEIFTQHVLGGVPVEALNLRGPAGPCSVPRNAAGRARPTPRGRLRPRPRLRRARADRRAVAG